jgi:ABC-type antimicrobial peptide transport system permease subunit
VEENLSEKKDDMVISMVAVIILLVGIQKIYNIKYLFYLNHRKIIGIISNKG